MKRSILTTAAVFTALFFVAAVANADKFYFVGYGCFDDPNHWYDACIDGSPLNDIPGADDRAIICSTAWCYLDADITVDTINVQGLLNIGPCCTLTLENDNDNLGGGAGNDHSQIDGEVYLKSNGACCAALVFMGNDHVLGTNAPGSIIGTDSCCEIVLDSDNLDLISNITIRGALTITQSGGRSNTGFENDGEVHADTAGMLKIAENLIGDSSGLWCVSNSNATLKIDAPSAGAHSGNVCVSAGTLHICDTFTTTGCLNFTGGMIVVDIGETFSATCTAPSTDPNTCCW
jgi:phage baseplate assembly protein gpV